MPLRFFVSSEAKDRSPELGTAETRIGNYDLAERTRL